jgi:apolipoprotein N-acyltransferase
MDQMIAASRLRAVETRRPVLRVTNTGRTALIGADGSILEGPAVGQPAAWSVNLPLVDPALRTFHQRLGYAILPVLAALAAVLALAPRRKAAIDRLRGAG